MAFFVPPATAGEAVKDWYLGNIYIRGQVYQDAGASPIRG
jgi:hypothetical protein